MQERDTYAEEVQRTSSLLAASIREFTFYRPLGESGPAAHQVRVWRHMLHNLRLEPALRQELAEVVVSHAAGTSPAAVRAAHAALASGNRIPYQEACALLTGLQRQHVTTALQYVLPMNHYDRSCIEQGQQAAAAAHARLRALHPYIDKDF